MSKEPGALGQIDGQNGLIVCLLLLLLLLLGACELDLRGEGCSNIFSNLHPSPLL